MKHAIGYLGRFDRDFEKLRPNPSTYTLDGTARNVDKRPATLDGIFFGYMELPGKRYVAVRAQYGELDVILKTPVPINPPRHTDSKKVGPVPTTFGDDSASRLLADMIAANHTVDEISSVLRQVAERLQDSDQGET